MTAKRFVNMGNDIFQYGEWWCSAGGEHCADVIVTALNQLIEENEQLKESYTQLKHRHSLLHDVCIEAECGRDRYHKDMLSLEKENEDLKNLLKDFVRISEDNGAISPIRVKCLVYDYIDGVDVE